MLRVVVTGGIGTGKSIVLARFAERGAVIADADALAHTVMAPGTPAAAAIRARFGDAVVAAGGRIDRPRLGEIVFRDADARAALEAIIHPAVYRAIQSWMDGHAAEGISVAVVEIPLLFETRHEDDFDRIVVTACESGEQVRRVMSRSGLAEEEVRRRIAAQWPLAEKIRRADYVIRTDGTLDETRRRADDVWQALLNDSGAGPVPPGRRL